MLASEDSDPPSTGGGRRAAKRASARAPGTPRARAEAPDPLAKVGFCRKPAFYLPVAGSRAPEMAL
jgi:hypothetical protein